MPGTVTEVTSCFKDRVSFLSSSWSVAHEEWENTWLHQQLYEWINETMLLWVSFKSVPRQGPFVLFDPILFL